MATQRLGYDTAFHWEDPSTMLTFYRVRPHLGFVPAGVAFSHLGADYSTAHILGALLPRIDPENVPRLALKKAHWTRGEPRAKFVELTRALEAAGNLTRPCPARRRRRRRCDDGPN